MCRSAGVSPGRRRVTRLTSSGSAWKDRGRLGSAWLSGDALFRLERRVSSSFLQAGWVGRYTLPPLLQGHPPHPDAPPSPCFAAESARGGTLMSLPEGIATQVVCGTRLGARGGAVSSVVTSGCPKRSEGGFPVGTRTNIVPSASHNVNHKFKTANKYGNSGCVTIDDTPGIPVHY